jgi:hypothetical protein
MTTEGLNDAALPVVLAWLQSEAEEHGQHVCLASSDAHQTAAGIGALDQRIEELLRAVPEAARRQATSPAPPPRQQATPVVLEQDWGTLVDRARDRLLERGIAPDACVLDDLLDPEEVQRIEGRFAGGFSLKTRLDMYDVGGIVAAGMVGALVDFLIVRIPHDVVYLGQHTQVGSPLTKWLRSLNVPENNWLAQHFRTSYDEVSNVAGHIPGFGPRTHRLQTFGHDPLVGLVIGTIDIMRGGLTGISTDGVVIPLTGTGLPNYNPLAAFVWQIMHLLSDGFTKMGLPAPGWSLLQLFRFGSFGERDRTVADLARFMYLKGYDSRHFLTMSTSVAATEVMLRGYFALRQKLDPEYGQLASREAEIVGSERISDHPRFQTLALGAHGVATAANAGKVAIYAGNPLSINYAQWLRFVSALFQWMKGGLRSPSEVLEGTARANWKELETGWPEIDAHCSDFPSLTVGQP